MDRIIENTLTTLGLSEKERKFFQTAVTLGTATINEVAKTARLERSTAYLIAESLIKQGLLKEDLKTYKKQITPCDPKTLLRMLSNQSRKTQRIEMEFEQNLPDLHMVFQTSDVLPKVRIFEGQVGLESLFEEILKAEKEILLWTNQETEKKFFTKELHNSFIEKRLEKKIFIKVLAVPNDFGRLLGQTDATQLRHTRLLPKTTQFSAETYIFNNTVITIDFDHDIFGVSIENKAIAQSHKAMFQTTWDVIAEKPF